MMTSKVMTNNNGDDIHNYNGHLDNNHPDNDDTDSQSYQQGLFCHGSC